MFEGTEEIKVPLFQDAPSQKKQLVPNPNSRQPTHFCHAFQTACQASQPTLKMKARVPSLLAH